MTISVVIPTLDEADEVVGAIESVLAEHPLRRPGPTGPQRPPESTPMLEIFVVDGGSRDATLDRVRALEAAGAPLRTLRSPRTGRASQLQRGLESSQGDIVLFLHADTRLPRGWLPALQGALSDPGVVGGAFRFAFAEAPAAGRWQRVQLRLVEWGARLRVALLGLPYGDQALFARRSVLEAIGGVPQVPLMEDLDLVARLRRRGRLARLSLPARTSPRRYLAGGVLRTAARHARAAWLWARGTDRARIASELER